MQYYEFLHKWPTFYPTCFLNQHLETNDHGSQYLRSVVTEISSRPRLEPLTSGLQIWCSPYWASWAGYTTYIQLFFESVFSNKIYFIKDIMISFFWQKCENNMNSKSSLKINWKKIKVEFYLKDPVAPP